MTTAVKTPRTYRSEKRSADAAATRRRVLDAATECFMAKGYASTTMREIAVAAGVAVDTVYATGSKRALLMAAYWLAMSGSDSDIPIPDRDESRAMAAIEDRDERLRAWIRFTAGLNAASAPLWPVLRGAAHADPGIAEDFAALLATRHEGTLGVVDVMQASGFVAPSPDSRDGLAHALEFLLAPDGYEELVLRGGWTMDRYVDWLEQQIRAAMASADG
jgi:AcrR family transcriptional regulator